MDLQKLNEVEQALLRLGEDRCDDRELRERLAAIVVKLRKATGVTREYQLSPDEIVSQMWYFGDQRKLQKEREAEEFHSDMCPRCGKAKPVDSLCECDEDYPEDEEVI